MRQRDVVSTFVHDVICKTKTKIRPISRLVDVDDCLRSVGIVVISEASKWCIGVIVRRRIDKDWNLVVGITVKILHKMVDMIQIQVAKASKLSIAVAGVKCRPTIEHSRF